MTRLGCCVLLMTACLATHAQREMGVQQELQGYRVQGNVVLLRLVAQVKTESSPSDRKIENTIIYEVVPEPGINGFAYQTNGQRKIDITAGLIEVIDWLSISEAVSAVKNTPSCNSGYTQYLGDIIGENTDLFRESLPRQMATSPYQYYAAHLGECPIIAPATVDSDKKITELRQIGQHQMLKLILLHEIGHQVHNDPFSVVSRCESQRRETRADAYSFKGLSRYGNMPDAAIGIFTIFAVTEGGSADDRWSDHPAALKRILAMLEATQKELMESYSLAQALKSTGKYDLYIGNVNYMENEIRKQIASVAEAHPESMCPD